jgi:hypothetical protein
MRTDYVDQDGPFQVSCHRHESGEHVGLEGLLIQDPAHAVDDDAVSQRHVR